MAETPDGLVFARGFNALWVMRDGRWQTCPGITGETSPPFCVTRDGALIAANLPSRELVSFSRWNGEQFVRGMGDMTGQEFDVQEVRAAPDGSIWAVGRGTILR